MTTCQGKALSVREPWVSAIVDGVKRFENRSWRTDYRGPLLIHAGRHEPEPEDERRAREWGWTQRAPYVLGAIIGQVELLDIVPAADVAGEPFAEGPWCWVLGEARRFAEPVPCLGKRRLFVVPPVLGPDDDSDEG